MSPGPEPIAAERLGDELEIWGRDQELSELDALMWRTDRHPHGAWSGVVLQMLDTSPDWGRLWAAHEWFLDAVPRFRQKVVEPILPVGTPMWVDDDHFDLAFHLRRVSLPAPGSRRQLLDLLQAIALTPMDRTRPPWEALVIEGLEGGGAAYAMHAHHVFMDGMALAKLHERVLNPTREHIPDKASINHAPMRRFSSLEVARTDVARQALHAPGQAAKILSTLARGLGSPRRTFRYARSLARVASPPPRNPSRVIRSGSRRLWRFGTLECTLRELRASGKAAGGTVNDTFVCALLGGLRHYCAAFGEDLGDVPISMPVSMRAASDAHGGNNFAAAYFLVPSGIADPATRIAEMHRRVDDIRGEPALDLLTRITPILNRTPAGIAATVLQALGGAVLTTSSWPGISEPRFMAGAEFERMFVFAPLPGVALTAAMCTHTGICCIGMNADGEVFTDTDLLWSSMQRGLDEVLAVGRA
jgi:WS/DGAT/MGAT family acyltransferase